MTTTAQEMTPSGAEAVFSRVVASVDGTEPSLEAARQAARLVGPDGWLEVFTAVCFAETNLAGGAELQQEAGEAARKGVALAGPRAESRLVDGPPLPSLRRELKEKDATLAVVGTHGQSRISEIVLGGVAGELLHNAPCSVLVARPPAVEALFPRAIVAGVDGSPESAAVVDVARYLANRFAASLSMVTALGGKDADLKRAYELGATAVAGHPVPALVEASRNADLLVVGSRGLHGLQALGSVSERVAHKANCSVLVVRASH